MFQLTRRLGERAVGGRVNVFGAAVLVVGGVVSHEELMAGKAQVNGHAVAVPAAVMVTGNLDHDVARDDPVALRFEPFDPFLDVLGESR
jgi:hypothetical protein